MNVVSQAVFVFVLVSTRECFAVPAPDPLDYLPALGYLRSVLHLSTGFLEELQLDPSVPQTYDVSEMIKKVHSTLTDTEQAVEITWQQLEMPGSLHMQHLADGLRSIQRSLGETNFRFPEYYRRENVSQEMDLLKLAMSEQLDRVSFTRTEFALSDLRELNGFLTGATSQAMTATMAVFLIASVEKLTGYLNLIVLPSHVETTELKDLLDIGVRVRAYDQLYAGALRNGSEPFQRAAMEGRQLVYTMLNMSLDLPENVKQAATEFTGQVDSFVDTSIVEMLLTKNAADEKFGEVLQNIVYTSYGLLSTGLAMMRPLPQHVLCVRDVLPRAQTIAGTNLMSIALCSNDASAILYDSVMEFREQIRLLQHRTFQQLHKAVGCSGNCASVYNATVDLFNASTAEVRGFSTDFEPHRIRLLGCLSDRYEIVMAEVLDISYNFNQCVKLSKLELFD
uniref:Uncharacterized protein n=1 Tax=Anopheles farauti TaxID=69004 RepID=A0A182QAZ1_9DIPT